jgi:hypothetical protein
MLLMLNSSDSAVFSQLVMEGAVGCRTRGREVMRTERHVGGGRAAGEYERLQADGCISASACGARARPGQTKSYTAGLPGRTSSSWCKEAAVKPLLVETNGVFWIRDWLLRVVY